MGKQGKMQKQRRQHAEMREREAAVAAAEAAAEMKMEAAVEAVVQEQERKAEAAAALQARNEKKERDEESRGRAEAGQGGSGEASVRRAVEVLAGKIEEMRVVAEQREQRSQMIYEDMNEAVGDVSYDTRAVGRSLGRLQLPRVEHGLCLRALERMGQQWEQQAAKMAGAVEQMREEMRAVQAGQRELALLASGLGAGVGDLGSGLGGLGSSVRAIQRQLDDRTGEQQRLAKLVSRMAAESGGQQTSPPDTVRKQKGLGRRMGGVKGRQLQFGSESEEKEQEQGKEEKASEQQEEVAQWYGGGGEAQGVYEEMRAEVGAEREEREREERVEREREEQEREEAAASSAWFQERCRRMREETKRVLALPWDCDERREWTRQDHALRSKERREEKERKQRDGYEGMSREEMMAWHNMNDMIKRDERSRRWEQMVDEQDRDEGEQWKEKWLWKWLWKKQLGEMSEREMSVWDDGREMREEVQLFGCASTAE
jgi:hypothetical protein